MTILAHAMNLGSCVIGAALHVPDATQKFLGLPEDRVIHSVVTLGYPKMNFRRTVYRRPVEVVIDSKSES